MLTIKVLGSGCPNCKRLEKETKKAVDHLAIEAQVVKVTNYNEIMAYDVLSTPGLVINEQVISTGRIPSQSELITFLTNALTEI